MVHPAKVDRWLAALLVGVAGVQLVAAAVVVVKSHAAGDPPLQESLATAAILVACATLMGLMLWGCYRTRYEITATDLVVWFGPFRSGIPLQAIREVFPTRNPLSAPAPSLDRLRINDTTRRGWTWFALVSPRDKAAFVRDLARAAPQLRSAGDGTLRLSFPTPDIN
jgi:hypothetical protein